MTMAAAASAGGLLLDALPPRWADAYEGTPAYVTNALEHQTYDMYTEWASWLRSAGAKGYLGEYGVPNSQKPLAPSEVQKWLGLFDKVYQILNANVDVVPVVTAHCASYGIGDNGFNVYGPERTDDPIRDRNFAVAFEQAPVVESYQPAALCAG